MSLRTAAALAALLAAGTGARAASAPETRVSGTVLTAEVASDPFADASSGAGSLVITDNTGHTETYSVLGTTRVTRDGKKIAFDTTLIGDMVVKATFDPQTKLLTVLDLKSAAAPVSWSNPGPKAARRAASAPAVVKGEVAFADAVKGTLSVRTGKGRNRGFAVVETTTVLREAADGPAQEVGFETVSVGEIVEVSSRDGKTADRIRVRASSR